MTTTRTDPELPMVTTTTDEIIEQWLREEGARTVTIHGVPVEEGSALPPLTFLPEWQLPEALWGDTPASREPRSENAARTIAAR